MKFVVSLKRSADLSSQRERQSTRLSLVAFAPPPDSRMSVISGNIEMDLVEHPNDRVWTRGPWLAHRDGQRFSGGQGWKALAATVCPVSGKYRPTEGTGGFGRIGGP